MTYELEVIARARMREHHERAQRLRDIAGIENRRCGRPMRRVRVSFARLLQVFAARLWVRATRQRPIREDS